MQSERQLCVCLCDKAKACKKKAYQAQTFQSPWTTAHAIKHMKLFVVIERDQAHFSTLFRIPRSPRPA